MTLRVPACAALLAVAAAGPASAQPVPPQPPASAQPAFSPYLGLLGLLIGPLAVSYFFELIQMYREEYVTGTA